MAPLNLCKRVITPRIRKIMCRYCLYVYYYYFLNVLVNAIELNVCVIEALKINELFLFICFFFSSKNSKLFWWDSATCGGPIVEQATHVSLNYEKTYTYKHASKYALTHACMHKHAHKLTSSYTHICKGTHAHMHAPTYAYACTHARNVLY